MRLTRQRSGTRTFSTRSPSQDSIAGSTVSEPIIATATTIIVPIANDMNVLSPEKNIPAIAIITVMPGDEHGAAGRRGGGLERRRLAPSRAALVALAADVEERVVDADGEPDQEDDLGDRLVHRDELARERDEPHASRTRT